MQSDGDGFMEGIYDNQQSDLAMDAGSYRECPDKEDFLPGQVPLQRPLFELSADPMQGVITSSPNLPVATIHLANVEPLLVAEDGLFYIDDTLAHIHVRIYRPINIFVCLQCFGGVAPDTLLGHMKKVHQFSCSESKGQIFAIADFYGVLHEANQVVFPDNMCPIPDLEVFSGFHCNSSGCSYTVRTHKRMTTHVKIHQANAQIVPFDTCLVQIPFRSKGSYCRVSSAALTTFSRDPYSIECDMRLLTEDFEAAVLEDNVFRVTSDPADTPPWLQRLYWPTLVHRLNPRVLSALVDLPRKNEPDLAGIRDALRAYFEAARVILQSGRYTTTRCVLHTKHDNVSVFLSVSSCDH